MGDTLKTEGPGDALPADERQALDAWTAPIPAEGFVKRVMARAADRPLASASASSSSSSSSSSSPGPGRGSHSAPRARGQRERRQRRRVLLATALGAVALSAGTGFVIWQAGAALRFAAAPHAGLSIYLSALAFGGILLVASLVGGHAHGAAELDDASGAAGADAGIEIGQHGVDGHAHAHDERGAAGDSLAQLSFLLPFLSLRFWIFGLAFFGLTGAIVGGLGVAGPVGAALAASALGLGAGYVAARVFQSMARQTIGDVAAAGDHLGREGRLLLPVARTQRGKVRVLARGVTTDLIAETDEEMSLPAGSTVLIVGMRGTVALVERSPAPGGSTPDKEEGGRT